MTVMMFVPVRSEAQLAYEAEKRRMDRERLDALRERKRYEKARGDTGSHKDMRWDPTRTRWVPDVVKVHASAEACRGDVVSGPTCGGAPPPAAPSTRSARSHSDDFASRMASYDDVAKLRKLGEANGVWDDKYLKLPNPGLIRMNVGNRLRAKVKRGETVQWA